LPSITRRFALTRSKQTLAMQAGHRPCLATAEDEECDLMLADLEIIPGQSRHW
jgi:hypothetical protein